MQAAADCIGKTAQKFGMDEAWLSPFAKGARDHGLYYTGGKLDDITVLVSEVHLK